MDTSYRETRGRARLGVVVPVSNTNLEPDMTMLAPRGVSVHFARAGGYDVHEIPDENQMRQYSDTSMGDVVDSLRICRCDVILYGCTSATLAQGPEYDKAFRENIERTTGIPAATAASALVEALAGLGIRRFAFTSPYVASLNDLAIGYLRSFGLECVGRADTPRPWGNEDIAGATPEAVIAMAEQADCEDAEVMVVSCTDFRATEAVPEIERRLGKPVVTSNQAMMVWGLRRLGLSFETSPLRDHLLVQRLANNPNRATRRSAAQ